MKEHIIQPDIYLTAVDKKDQLVLKTDGSDDGWDAIFLQIIGGETLVIGMWTSRVMLDEDKMTVIDTLFVTLSKKW